MSVHWLCALRGHRYQLLPGVVSAVDLHAGARIYVCIHCGHQIGGES